MTKYNFGYKIQPGTTTAWARDIIPAGCRVLEFGPSIGYLTKALSEKSCKVDIVEIDQDAGLQAAQFATKSLVGSEDGNVENLRWCSVFQEGSYDAIVFLDVLEHLHDPEKVLLHVVRYLKPDGKLYLSVPNIAHNSVIINLINNKWEYTELGLLDNTHIHFFTYRSLMELFRKLNLTVEFQGAIQKMVGDNEISCDYADVSMELAVALRDRQYADAYQFLFQLSKQSADCRDDPVQEEMQLKKQLNTGLSAELSYQYSGEPLDSQRMIKKYYPGPVFSEKIKIPCENDRRPEHLVVGFPMHCCIVSGFTATPEQDDSKSLRWITNGIQLENGDIVLADGNSQVDIIIPSGVKEVALRWNILHYDSSVISYMHSVVNARKNDAQLLTEKNQLKQLLNESRIYAQSLMDSIEAERNQSAALAKYLQESRTYAQSLKETIQAEQSKSLELEALLSESREYAQSLMVIIQSERDRADKMQGELNRIYHSKWWKLVKEFIK